MLDRDRYWDCLDQAQQASSGGRLEEALAWFDEALRANPDGAEAHNGRGEIFWDNGRVDEALREFERAIEMDAELQPGHLNRVELLIEEFQDQEEALASCDALLEAALDEPTEAEVYYLKAKALFYLDDLDGALFLLKRAIRTHPEPVYRAFEGQILFEMGRYEAARASLEQALALDAESAHALYYMALVHEHAGDPERADTFFAQAANLAPDIYQLPVRIEADDFQAAAEQAVASLPAEIRRYVANCPILIEDLPDRDLVQSENVSPQVLGLFLGTPATEPGASPNFGTGSVLEPDRVLLFKRNLEKIVGSREELLEQVQITVKHEIGHFLGLEEDDMERLGLA
jgi:predicted Zn-dependent protease with MMP-like domain/predicted negative regulator of RcsB-dependent stress response